MLKFKPPMNQLSMAIAFSLFASTASASTLYSTYRYLFDSNGNVIAGAASGQDTLYEAEDQWVAGYFFINPVSCPNGCDLTGAKLQLIGGSADSPTTPSSFAGVTLEIFSNTNQMNALGKHPGDVLFTLNTPSTVTFDGNFGTKVNFTANAQDQSLPALLQPNTGYWLKLTNVSRAGEFGWFFNGVQSNEYWAGYYGSGQGSPYIFEINGANSATPRLSAPTHAPIPGAAWMMGSALIGFPLAARRKKRESAV